MTWYTVQTSYAAWYANTVSVEAETLEEALEKAIEAANQDPNWKSVDHCGPSFVDACCVGRDEDPWDRDRSLPIPARFTERGEPPVVTLTGPHPPGGVEVTGGTVRIRFVDNAATVTTEVSDPPPPGSKPMVIVRPRPDGAPEIEVTGGKAIIRVQGWEGIDHDQS